MRHRPMTHRARTVLIAAAALVLVLAVPVLAAPVGSDSPAAPAAPPASAAPAAPATAPARDAPAASAAPDASAASTVPAAPTTPVPPASSAAPAAPAASVAPAAGGAGSWDKYRLLTERNIFLRDRRRPSTGRPAPRGPIEPLDSDRYLVLTGTVNYGDEFVAFFEDTRAGKTVRTRVGKTIGNGTLKAITLRGVEYDRRGTVTKIAIGRTLTGSVATLIEKVAAVLPEPPKPGATGAPPDAGQGRPPDAPREGRPGAPPESSAAPPGAPQADAPLDPGMAQILEGMRQRREQELRQ